MLPRQDNDKEERVSIEEMSNVKDGKLLLGIRFNAEAALDTSASTAQNDFGLNEGEYDRQINVYHCPN